MLRSAEITRSVDLNFSGLLPIQTKQYVKLKFKAQKKGVDQDFVLHIIILFSVT